jgi:hypothetical protein
MAALVGDVAALEHHEVVGGGAAGRCSGAVSGHSGISSTTVVYKTPWRPVLTALVASHIELTLPPSKFRLNFCELQHPCHQFDSQ